MRDDRVPLTADWRANAGDPRVQLALVLFRTCHRWRQGGSRCPVWLARAACLVYRVLVEWTWGIELPWNARVGPGLTIWHGTGVVVSGDAVLGSGVALHQNVCLGARRAGGGSPVVEDGVNVGVGAIVLGEVTIGAGAKIGAGAVVLTDVPPGAVAVGNPARLIPRPVETQAPGA